uniref:ANK_REP_REGION domain-containing protein n=1 Tax=Heterorhabditis bacteriophora TaxID=37862 RepID=A0A1I7WM98_HETBA
MCRQQQLSSGITSDITRPSTTGDVGAHCKRSMCSFSQFGCYYSIYKGSYSLTFSILYDRAQPSQRAAFNVDKHRDKKGFTPLILAATGGHVGVVELFLTFYYTRFIYI